MADNEQIILPEKYYLENFHYLLSFVANRYQSILNQNERDYLIKFDQLSENAQCLLVRMISRKGIFFRKKTLEYAEIGSPKALIDELASAQFVKNLTNEHSLEFIKFLTKEEILLAAKGQLPKSLKKDDLIEKAIEQNLIDEILNHSIDSQSFLVLNHEQTYSFIIFLFFGNRYHGMTEFVLRDLGIRTYEKIHDDAIISQFSSRKEADDKWMISVYKENYDDFKKNIETAELLEWILNIEDVYQGKIAESAARSFEKLKLTVGQELERRKAFDMAILVYETVQIHPSRERRIRCMFKLKQNEEALSLCNEILHDYQNADELFFAQDQLDKWNAKARKKTTDKLKEAMSIQIDKTYRGQVELGTLSYFFDEGYEGLFSENFLWRGLFGLTFWDIIFDISLATFHHPLQRRPSDLYKPDFFIKREKALQKRLDEITDANDWIVLCSECFVEKFDIVNPFVVWVDEVWLMVRKTLEGIDIEKLKKVLFQMAKNLVDNSRGFPDLMIWDEEKLFFIEVKSPTDSLSNQQLFWLQFFEEIGIDSKPLKVEFSE